MSINVFTSVITYCIGLRKSYGLIFKSLFFFSIVIFLQMNLIAGQTSTGMTFTQSTRIAFLKTDIGSSLSSLSWPLRVTPAMNRCLSQPTLKTFSKGFPSRNTTMKAALSLTWMLNSPAPLPRTEY